MGVILLSIGDLLITVTYLRSTGMMEANPIAETIIRVTGSVAALAAYKALTVGICVSLLYRLRRLVEGEVAAWCAVAILALLAIQWHNYARAGAAFADVELARTWAPGDGWLVPD